MNCLLTLSPGIVSGKRCLRPNRLRPNSVLSDIFISSTTVVASGALLLSSLQLLNSVAQLPEQAESGINLGDDDESFVWSVATVLSIIPVFNFTVRPL